MLRRRDIDHILRAAASLSGHGRFVMVGSGGVIAIARHIPVAMMRTEEIDIYAAEVPNPDFVSDLIDASRSADPVPSVSGEFAVKNKESGRWVLNKARRQTDGG
jgi:hypothetical protein